MISSVLVLLVRIKGTHYVEINTVSVLIMCKHCKSLNRVVNPLSQYAK